jgi:hypothetical protein
VSVSKGAAPSALRHWKGVSQLVNTMSKTKIEIGVRDGLPLSRRVATTSVVG